MLIILSADNNLFSNLQSGNISAGALSILSQAVSFILSSGALVLHSVIGISFFSKTVFKHLYGMIADYALRFLR